MTAARIRTAAPAAAPHAVIRFEVRDGARRVAVAVADEALEAVSGLTAPSTPAVRQRSFDRFRTLIDAAAKLKLAALPPGFAGPLMLSSNDLRRVPPATGVPGFGTAPRTPAPLVPAA